MRRLCLRFFRLCVGIYVGLGNSNGMLGYNPVFGLSLSQIPGTKTLFCEYSISMDRCLVCGMRDIPATWQMKKQEKKNNFTKMNLRFGYRWRLFPLHAKSFKWTLIIGGKWKHARITNGNNFERRFAKWNVGIYLSVASCVHVVFLFAIKTVMVCGHWRKTCRHTEMRDKEATTQPLIYGKSDLGGHDRCATVVWISQFGTLTLHFELFS